MATVLVVDDDPSIVALLTDTVSDAGCAAITATNGRDALALAREHKPILVISDVLMPVMDGHSLLESLRADPAVADTMVLLMSGQLTTAYASLDSITIFVAKPLDIDLIELFLYTVL